MAASYICNRIPHSALNMETPYKLYRKDADLSHLKITCARAFVHIKHPNKLGHTLWKGTVCGSSETETNSYLIWNPKTHRVVSAGTSLSSKHHQICFPRPGGSRRNKISTHRCTISATTSLTTTMSRTTTCGGTCRTTPPL